MQMADEAYLVRVVQVQNPTLGLVDVLVAGGSSGNHEGGIHVHVVAGKVEGNQSLEKDSPAWEG